MINQGVLIFISGGNVTEGNSITYTASINNVNVLYNNGLDKVFVEYTSNESEIIADPFHKVKIGVDAEDSINNLKLFFESNGYISSSITILYSTEIDETGSGIRVKFITEKKIFFDISNSFGNLIINSFSNNVEPTTSLKYFLQYKNISNDNYKLEIFEKNFSGESKEINGRVAIYKADVNDHLDPIRGQGLDIEIECSEDNNFSDFFSINERDFQVRFYRNNAILFDGFLKPDGVYQSFSSDVWKINIQAVDGLGFLEGLSFVNTNGVNFNGKMSFLEVIYNCLQRTGVQSSISTYLNIKYHGMIDDRDVLTEAKISIDRFIIVDQNDTISCLQILKDVLNVLNACITQHYGTWFIYRPSDFFYNEHPIAREYKPKLDFYGYSSFLPLIKIGSQKDNFAPFHCNSNQKIEVKGAVSAFRLGYKYGFISSILSNGSLYHEAGTKIYEGWAVQNWAENQNSGFLVIDPVSTTGISFKSGVNMPGVPSQLRTALRSTTTRQATGGYSFEFRTRFISYGFPASIAFTVSVGNYSLNTDGTWFFSTTQTRQNTFFNSDTFPNGTGELVDEKFERTISITSDQLPDDAQGIIRITMNVPRKAMNGPDTVLVEVKSIELINTFSGNNVVGEFHTVSRVDPVSSIVKENKSVYNGDSRSDFYKGAIYMANGNTLTKNWYRIGLPNNIGLEEKPLLRITAEEYLRMYQVPTKIFTGDIYGFWYYLSIYRINNIPGKFMPISWRFDTFSNITSLKLLELYCPELNSIQYLKTDDYGEVTRPTIVG